MAKRRKTAQPFVEAPIGLPKGDALVGKLREYHQRGVDILENGDGRSEAELIELFKVSKDQLYKTQAFARYYEPEELEALCADRDADGNPLRWAHVRELLVYRDERKAWLRMQRRAVRGHWTVDELREQIRRDRRGQSRVAGRRAGPRFKFDSIPELIRKSEEIEHQLASLLADVGSEGEPGRRIDDLLAKATDADREALQEVARKLTKLSCVLKCWTPTLQRHDFAKAFWQFVREGRYENQEQAAGKRQLYRFTKPQTDGFPFMLELFSRTLDTLTPAEGSVLTPIPFGDEVSSLSAILLDDDYYTFLMSGKQEIDGVQIVGAEHLIPLKARAWLDLTERKTAGGDVDSRNIKKHRNDVFRLFTIVDPEFAGLVPRRVQLDMAAFLEKMPTEALDLKAMGLAGQTLDSVIAEIRRIYGLGI